jgi:lipopolysaccharide/colanic/teichoic acid biosynthesis glycosyltransferase
VAGGKRIVPDWQLHYLAYQPNVASIYVSPFYGVQTLTLMSVPKSQGKLFLKALFDYTAGGVLLALSLPVFFVAAGLIKATSPGPVFYRQERLGRNGRRFQMIKFRTMVAGADQRLDEVKCMNECDGPVFKIRKDPRIIPFIGTLLRKTSMDELPQLINVVRGEMSQVGPRPPIPAEVDEYEVWQRRRLSMKPGITCLWQIAPRRNDLPFSKWMELDLAYIDQWSLHLDFLILFRTVKAVLMGAGR